MNFGEIKQVVCDRLGVGTSDIKSNRLVTDAINEAHLEILTMRGIGPKLRQIVLPFVTIPLSPIVALPQALKSISVITDRLNNHIYHPFSTLDMRKMDPNLSASSSSPYSYSVLSMSSPLARDIATASELFVVSTSSEDTGGIQAHLEGITASGQIRRVNITMGGLTPISVDSAITDWIAVTKFFLTAVAAGHVSLLDSDGVELAVIGPGRSYARYFRMQLHPTPTTALTLHADAEVNVEPMVDPYDEPLVLPDFHWLLICGGLMKEYERKEKFPQYDREKVRWTAGVNNLRSELNRQTGPADCGRVGFSQLGAWFPPGT